MALRHGGELQSSTALPAEDAGVEARMRAAVGMGATTGYGRGGGDGRRHEASLFFPDVWTPLIFARSIETYCSTTRHEM